MLVWSDALAPDAAIVVIMLAIEVYLLTQIVPRRGPPPTLTRMIIGSTALLGSASVLMALTAAFMTPTLGAYSIVLLTFNFMMLGPPGVWIIAVILLHDRRIDPMSWVWPLAIAGMATAAEVLMGLFFVVANGATPLDPADVAAATFSSAWFLWAMVGAMGALLLWLPLPRALRVPLAGLAASGVVAPWVPAEPLLGAALMAGVMSVTLAAVFLEQRHAPAAEPRVYTLLLGVFAGFLGMTVAGTLVALAPGSLAALFSFGLAMAAVMTAEFTVLVREGLAPGGARAGASPPLSAANVQPARA